MTRSSLYVATLFLLAFSMQSAPAAKLYKWVDEQGNVQFSDKVPPEYAKQERKILNEQGLTVDTVERAKTPEEIAQEKRLAELRAEQQRLIAEQAARDRVLLNTFRSEDDILLARDGKLAAVDVLIKVTEGNIKRIQDRLTEMQNNAARMERAGETVSPKFLAQIDDLRRQIRDAQASITAKEAEKGRIHTAYDADASRFRSLRNLTTHGPGGEQTGGADRAKLVDSVECKDPAACDRAWPLAEAYVRQHATTPMEMLSDSIIMTASPRGDQDVGITVSRIPQGEGEGFLLFIDVQCRDTPNGRKFCESDKVKAVRSGFQAHVEGGLKQ